MARARHSVFYVRSVACTLVTLTAPFLLVGAAPPRDVALAAPRVSDVGGAVMDGDFADPFVLVDGPHTFAFATGRGSVHVQVARASSSDLRFERIGDALPSLPRWAEPDARFTWAPSVLRRKAGYVLYYTARDARSGFQCIGRASAARPEGPYRDDSDRPLVCQTETPNALCGSIDPSPFVDDDERAFLLWKSDENSSACRGASRLWSQALRDDGLALTGAPTALLGVDRAWEGPLVEAPSMVRAAGSYFLFYSANWYESDRYAIGVARCASATGPCEKITRDAPLAGTRGEAAGPGGQEFFVGPRGELMMAHHAWSAGAESYAAGGARTLRIARVTFEPATSPRAVASFR